MTETILKYIPQVPTRVASRNREITARTNDELVAFLASEGSVRPNKGYWTGKANPIMECTLDDFNAHNSEKTEKKEPETKKAKG